MDRFLQQMLNRFLGRFLNQMVTKGISHIAGGGKSPADMTPAEHEQAKQARALAQKARKVQRASRRMF